MSRRMKEYSWDKHELLISKTDDLLVHHLKIPDSIMFNVKFTNLEDVMVVTGDFGNYIFCRPFQPSPDGSVSDGYWLEKLFINSMQDPLEFDKDANTKEINERLQEPGLTDEVRDYYETLKGYMDEDYDGYYRVHSSETLPSSMDYDDIPIVYKPKARLLIVFDAFEEVCRRLKENKQ